MDFFVAYDEIGIVLFDDWGIPRLCWLGPGVRESYAGIALPEFL